jgi:hypothetical protein
MNRFDSSEVSSQKDIGLRFAPASGSSRGRDSVKLGRRGSMGGTGAASEEFHFRAVGFIVGIKSKDRLGK